MTQPQRIRSLEEQEAFDRMQELADAERVQALRDVLATLAGRRVLWWLLEQCHLYHQSWSPGQADRTAFLEGERSIGLRLLDQIERVGPLRYAQMREEALERARQRESEHG
jgi:hypothetical protein